jgi:hypothetical protein
MKDYSGPSYLEVDDFNKLSLSDKFFARKFPKESSHPIRLKMLNYINSIDYDRDSLSSWTVWIELLLFGNPPY